MNQLKYLVHLMTARNEQMSCSLPFIGLESIESYTGRLVEEFDESLACGLVPVSESKSGTRFCRGDVLFGKLRPYLAKVWIAECEGVCTTEALVIRPHSIEPRYLKYFLLSPLVMGSIGSATFGSKMPRADWQYIGNMFVPELSIEQQSEIADYLDHEMSAIIGLEETYRDAISLLAERRAALISAAVTGDKYWEGRLRAY